MAGYTKTKSLYEVVPSIQITTYTKYKAIKKHKYKNGDLKTVTQ